MSTSRWLAAGIRWMLVLVVVCLLPVGGLAAWQDGGLLLTDHSVSFYIELVAQPDGSTVVFWLESQEMWAALKAQRFDARGNPLWAAGGVTVSSQASAISLIGACPGLDGRTLVFWTEVAENNDELRGQCLSETGQPLWTAGGVLMITGVDFGFSVVAVPDQAGGAWVAWDKDFSTDDYDVFLQHVDADGTLVQSLITVCQRYYSQEAPQMVPDGSGGVIVAWRDFRNGGYFTPYDVYAMRYRYDGAQAWSDEVLLAGGGSYVDSWKLAGNGMGGAWCSWTDDHLSSDDQDVFVQFVDLIGFTHWDAGGYGLCITSDEQGKPNCCMMDDGGLLVAWLDGRGVSTGSKAIYAQRLDGQFHEVWAANGIRVDSKDSPKSHVSVLPCGDGSAIVGWRESSLAGNLEMSQRLSAYGSPLWGYEEVGAGACTSDLYREQFQVSDGAGGRIFAWCGESGGLYLQRQERNGYWGYPAPDLTSVTDVPGDQGGYVTVRWEASRLDDWQELGVSQYSVWRALAGDKARELLARGATLVDGGSLPAPAKGDAPVLRRDAAKSDLYWELVGTQQASQLARYAATAPTTSDSTAVWGGDHVFQVLAHGLYDGVWWASEPMGGHSVDNLAPAAVKDLAARVLPQQVAVRLTWSPNTEADLDHYHVYRGTSADFTPSEQNRIAAPSDTTVVDTGWSWGGTYYYKVAAVDVHGNEGPASLVTPADVTAVPVPSALVLEQNTPNPFNPRTSIEFALPIGSEVTLGIYDLSGRLVRTLVRGSRAAGRHHVVWDGTDDAGRAVASGVYLYRLEAAGRVLSRRLVLGR